MKPRVVAVTLLTATCLSVAPRLGAPARTVALQRVDLSGLPAVVVYATVIDERGQSVLGLTDREVSVAIDAVPQAVTSFASAISGGEHLSVALLFDRSGSMKTAIGRTKDAALEFVRRLSRDDRLAVVSFDDTVRVDSPFSSDRAALESAIQGIATGTDTALYDAIRQALDLLASERTKRQAIVVLSDGRDTKSTRPADEVLAAAKNRRRADLHVRSRRRVNTAVLARLATETGGTSATAREPDELRLLYQRIADELSNQYILAFTSSFGEDGAWRRLRIDLHDAKGSVASAERPFISDARAGCEPRTRQRLRAERRAPRARSWRPRRGARPAWGSGSCSCCSSGSLRRDVSLASPLAIGIVMLSGALGGIAGVVVKSLWR